VAEEKEKIVLVDTCDETQPEKACFPFLLATAAQSMDVEAVVVLQSDGVNLAKKGYAEKISVPGFTPLKTLIDSYVNSGGKILL